MTTSATPDSALSGQPATARGQKSLQNRRLRGFRAPPVRLAPLRVCPVGADMRTRLLDVWPGLMLRNYPSDAACADAFGKERQTATNWRSGHCGPDAGSVSIAFLRWPDEMARLLGGAA